MNRGTAARGGLSLVQPSGVGASASDAPTFDTLLEDGQAAERRGARAEARRLYEQALYGAASDAEGRRASRTLRWIARTYVADANMEAAMDCLTAAEASAEAWGDESACGHAINGMAVVKWQLGELDEAERLYLTARARSLRAGDAKLAAMTAQNLGVIANVRGDHAEARRHYEASLAEYRALGLAKDVTVALNNIGLLHTQAANWEDAERAFREAVQISDAVGDVSARILLDVNSAEMWVARAEFARAQQCVKHALDLAAGTGDGSAIGQASKLLGIIARETGDVNGAEDQFRRAEEIARARQDVLLEAEVSRELGELARRQGRNGHVLRHLNRSHRLFSQLRARRDIADIDQRSGRLEGEFLQVARRWGESIEAKDRYTQGHCVRVADLSCAIAADLGIGARELFWFRIGALLHDVGKIVIPEEVLNKPGKLTDEEWALMRSHTTAGVEMLAGIEFPGDVIPIVLSHHERVDGRGYPEGLKGNAIPLVARILCVADVYDALTSVRSYKRAMTHQQAIETMRLDVGTMFDAQVFAAFERIAPEWSQRARREALENPVDQAAAPEEVAASAESPAEQELDDLTRMPLRRAFRETAQRVLEARKTTERPVSMLVIDIDHFKLVNDTFGHLQGDDVLRLVADVLRVQTRPSDFVARYAGDEFVALLPGTTLDDALAIAERLRLVVEHSSCAARDGVSGPVRVTLSIGAATAPQHGDALDSLFAAADGALYGSKRRGRNAVSASGSSGSAREASLLLDTFVGRADERVRIRRLLDGACNGSPAVLSVVGEAGVGKSTLLRQLAPDVGVRTGSLLFGRCLEADVRPPYGPWTDIIGAVHALDIVPARPWRELGRLVPGLGAPAATTSGAGGSASSARYTLIQEIEEYLTAAAAVRPLVVILDDMQWADAETWDVLELLVPRLNNQRLLLCLTIRREDLSSDGAQRVARLSRNENFSEIALGRLSRDEMEHWLRSALGGQSPSAALVDRLLTQTEGNPLFAVQTLRMLSEDGGLSFEEGSWRYEPSPDASLPTAVRELLARRLGRLADSTRDVLTAAAVFGTAFDADLLIGALAIGEHVVFDALDDGVRALVLATNEARGPAAFEFTHGLLADALRRAGSPLRLRRVHERVARQLEQHAHGAPAEIAEHFDRAGCAPEAHRYALLAAERAVLVYAHDAAAAGLAMAARHARTLAQNADVLWRQATLEEIVGHYESAESQCALLLTSFAAGAEELCIARPARRMKERLRLLRGAPAADVLRACTALHAAARRADDPEETVAILMMLSQVHGRLGDDVSAESTARAAIAEAASLGNASLDAEAMMRLGSAVLLATPAAAVQHYRQALDIFGDLDDRRGQLRSHINIGVACDRAGNHPAAEQSYATALEIGREVKAADLTALASMNLGVLLMKTGRFGEARQRLDETLRLYTSVNNEPHRLGALYNLAHLARERGDAGGATELYGAACQLAQSLGQLDVHVGALCGVGLAELALGQIAAAHAQLAAAQVMLAGREQRWFQGRELLVALDVRLLLARGERPTALVRLREALDEVEHHDQYAAVWLAAECAGALRREDRASDAWRSLTEKYALHARSLGYSPLTLRLAQKDAAAA